MNTQELRIGNIINTPHGIKKVTGVIDDRVYCTEFQFLIQELGPVIITEDWLFKFNLERDRENGISIYDLSRTDYWIQKEDEIFWIYHVNMNGYLGHKLTSVDYVHEFQNLYYCLSGEELEIEKL